MSGVVPAVEWHATQRGLGSVSSRGVIRLMTSVTAAGLAMLEPLLARLPLELSQHRLCVNKVVIEDFPGHRQQFRDQSIAQRILHRGAHLACGDDVFCPENGELLRYQRLLETERFLQLLNAVLPGSEDLKNPDPDGVREGAEEVRLEDLKGTGHRAIGDSGFRWL